MLTKLALSFSCSVWVSVSASLSLPLFLSLRLSVTIPPPLYRYRYHSIYLPFSMLYPLFVSLCPLSLLILLSLPPSLSFLSLSPLPSVALSFRLLSLSAPSLSLLLSVSLSRSLCSSLTLSSISLSLSQQKHSLFVLVVFSEPYGPPDNFRISAYNNYTSYKMSWGLPMEFKKTPSGTPYVSKIFSSFF